MIKFYKYKETEKMYFCTRCGCHSYYGEMCRCIESNQVINPGNKWNRFRSWLCSIDISYVLAWIGVIVFNAVLILHLSASFTECLILGFSLGLFLPRLLK